MSASALYEWAAMKRRSTVKHNPSPRRPEDWTAEEKFAAVLAAAAVPEAELGAFLRERGLHEAHLQDWRHQAQQALVRGDSKNEVRLAKEVKRLSREVARKDRALAEATALLVLSKKVRALWGDEGDDT